MKQGVHSTMPIGSIFGIPILNKPNQRAIQQSSAMQYGRPVRLNAFHHGGDKILFGANTGNRLDLPQEPHVIQARQLRARIEQNANAAAVQAFLNTRVPSAYQRANVLHHTFQDGRTLLHLAVDNHNPELVRVLAQSAPVLERSLIINQPDLNGINPLRQAIIANQPAMIRHLIQAIPEGERIEMINQAHPPSANTLLHEAVFRAANEPNNGSLLEVVRALVETIPVELRHHILDQPNWDDTTPRNSAEAIAIVNPVLINTLLGQIPNQVP